MDSKIIDQTTYDFIFSNIKVLNNTAADELIVLFMDKVINNITIKTNRNRFPVDLKYLVIDLVVDLLALNKVDTNPQDINSIQSMSEDGRTINFGANSYTNSKLNLLIQQKLNENETLINRYRLLYKVRCPVDEQD